MTAPSTNKEDRHSPITENRHSPITEKAPARLRMKNDIIQSLADAFLLYRIFMSGRCHFTLATYSLGVIPQCFKKAALKVCLLAKPTVSEMSSIR